MSNDSLQPLEGEQTIPSVVPAKPKSDFRRLLIFVAVMATLVGAVGTGTYLLLRKPVELETPAHTQEAVQAAVATPNALNMTTAPAPADSASAPSTGASGAVPSIAVNEPDGPLNGQAIPVKGGTGAGASRKQIDPLDAPIFPTGTGPDLKGAKYADNSATQPPNDAYEPSVPTAGAPGVGSSASDARASLERYKKQVSGMMDSLQQRLNGQAPRAPAATGASDTVGAQLGQLAQFNGAVRPSPTGGPGPSGVGGGILGMDRSGTGHLRAGHLGDRSLIVPKGTLFLCSLQTRVVTATSGFIGCQVSRNVYSHDRKVLLIERGSHLDGEYRMVQVKPGLTRVPVIWTRLLTPLGITVALDSPATGELGESGLGGYVDNRWGERLGAALMLSLIQDAIQYETEKASNSSDSSASASPVVLANTTGQSSKLAELVLSTTINIPPLLYANQGGMAGVYVAHDLDFSSVYELLPQEVAHGDAQ